MIQGRLKTCAKWGFTVAAEVCGTLFVLTGWVDAEYKDVGPRFTALTCGTLYFGETLETYTYCDWRVDHEAVFHLWFDYDRSPPIGFVLWWVRIPLWMPALVAGAAAGLLWRSDLRRRRIPGSCAQCGYDRRGLAEGAKCPECGRV